jgi:hypothetical protein
MVSRISVRLFVRVGSAPGGGEQPSLRVSRQAGLSQHTTLILHPLRPTPPPLLPTPPLPAVALAPGSAACWYLVKAKVSVGVRVKVRVRVGVRVRVRVRVRVTREGEGEGLRVRVTVEA